MDVIKLGELYSSFKLTRIEKKKHMYTYMNGTLFNAKISVHFAVRNVRFS